MDDEVASVLHAPPIHRKRPTTVVADASLSSVQRHFRLPTISPSSSVTEVALPSSSKEDDMKIVQEDADDDFLSFGDTSPVAIIPSQTVEEVNEPEQQISSAPSHYRRQSHLHFKNLNNLPAVASPEKRGPGRPLGSFNKPKTPDANFSPRRSRRLSGQDPED